MFPFRKDPLNNIVITTATQGGQRQSTLARQDTFTYWAFLTFAMAVTIAAGPVTAIRGNGSLLQTLDFVGFSENGVDKINVDARMLFFLSQMMAPSATSEARLVSTANGTTNLAVTLVMPFSDWNMANPGETSYRESEPKNQTVFFAQFSNNAIANLVNPGAATVTFGNMTINVDQMHNRNQKTLPLFRPFLRQTITPVSATNPLLQQFLYANRWLGALVIMQDSNVGVVTDIINAMGIRSDVRDYIGPLQQTWAALQREQELEFGGAVFSPAAPAAIANVSPMLGLNWRYHGQLSTLIAPNETNLRAEFNVQPSVTGGVTSSLIRILYWEFERDTSNFVGPNGQPRLIVAPTLPGQLGL